MKSILLIVDQDILCKVENTDEVIHVEELPRWPGWVHQPWSGSGSRLWPTAFKHGVHDGE